MAVSNTGRKRVLPPWTMAAFIRERKFGRRLTRLAFLQPEGLPPSGAEQVGVVDQHNGVVHHHPGREMMPIIVMMITNSIWKMTAQATPR